MGCGKSTTGKQLSESLGFEFIDMDEQIQRMAGHSISSIFKMKGEEYFRKVEARILRTIEQENVVVATGGGCPVHYNNMDHILKSGKSVFLKMTPEVAFERLKDAKGDRPLLKGLKEKSLLSWINDQMAEREKFYAMANIVVDAAKVDLEKLVAEIQSR